MAFCLVIRIYSNQHSVIAVHGVNGHYTRTWSSNKTLWLSDVLPNRIPNSRVMSFGYRSNPRTGLGLVDAEGLRQIARDLLQQLQDMRTPKTDFDEVCRFAQVSRGSLIFGIDRASQSFSSATIWVVW
jgi:hypothetical protein